VQGERRGLTRGGSDLQKCGSGPRTEGSGGGFLSKWCSQEEGRNLENGRGRRRGITGTVYPYRGGYPGWEEKGEGTRDLKHKWRGNLTHNGP